MKVAFMSNGVKAEEKNDAKDHVIFCIILCSVSLSFELCVKQFKKNVKTYMKVQLLLLRYSRLQLS